MTALSSSLAKLLIALSTPLFGFRIKRTFDRFRDIDAQQNIMQDQNTLINATGFAEAVETEHYAKLHSVDDGIERIIYTPQNRHYEAPILFQHGMWHKTDNG